MNGYQLEQYLYEINKGVQNPQQFDSEFPQKKSRGFAPSVTPAEFRAQTMIASVAEGLRDPPARSPKGSGLTAREPGVAP